MAEPSTAEGHKKIEFSNLTEYEALRKTDFGRGAEVIAEADDKPKLDDVGQKVEGEPEGQPSTKADDKPKNDGKGDIAPKTNGEDTKEFTKEQVDKIVQKRLNRQKRSLEAQAKAKMRQEQNLSAEGDNPKEDTKQTAQTKKNETAQAKSNEPMFDDFEDWEEWSEAWEEWDAKQSSGQEDAGGDEVTEKSAVDGDDNPDGDTSDADDEDTTSPENSFDPDIVARLESLDIAAQVAIQQGSQDSELYEKFWHGLTVTEDIQISRAMLSYMSDNPEQGIPLIAAFVDHPSKSRDILALNAPFNEAKAMKALFQELESHQTDSDKEAAKMGRQKKEIPDIKPLRGGGTAPPANSLLEAAKRGDLASYEAMRSKM